MCLTWPNAILKWDQFLSLSSSFSAVSFVTFGLFPPFLHHHFPPPSLSLTHCINIYIYTHTHTPSIYPYLWCEDGINTIVPFSLSPIISPFVPMSLSLSLRFLFSIMMTFCKKSVQSLLGLITHKTNGTVLLETPHHDRNIPSPSGGISFITLFGNIQPSVPYFLESAVAKSPPSSPAPAASTTRGPGGIGFLEDVGGIVGGLMSCTESLGFESSDERRVNDDDQFQSMNNDEFCLKRTIPIVRSPKNEVKKKFPPPLSSLDQNGKPTFFLRHVRKDGRLQLTEMKIHRPEILRASRQDGRLRLRLISSSDEDEDEDVDVDVEEVLQDEAKEEEEEEEEIEEVRGGGGGGGKRGEEWLFPVKNGGRDGIRRCHEVASKQHHHHNQHHHNLHAWRQHCVTIR